MCVAADNGSTHVGGRLVLSAGVPAAVDENSAACDAQATNTRLRHQSGDVLSLQYHIDVHVFPNASAGTVPTAVWLCADFRNAGSSVLSKRVIVSNPGSVLPQFLVDSTTPYPYAVTPATLGKPSSACQANSGTRLLNMQAGDAHIWAYTRQSGSMAQVCLRGERPHPGPTTSDGVLLQVDTAGGVSAVEVNPVPVTDFSVCPANVFTDTSNNPELSLKVSNPGTLPAWACVRVDETYLRIKVTPSTNQGVVTVTRD